jgi:hypothetical protein
MFMKISNILHKVILTLSTLCLLNPLLIVQAGEVTSHTLPDNQWHLISLPYSPGTNNTISDIFGDDGLGVYDSDWVIYSYNTATNKYIKPRLTDTLSQGVGYWIIQYTDSDKKLDMSKNSTPTTNTAACSTDSCFKIPLATKPGTSQWNMLGYPFSSEELLSKTRVDTTSPICSSGCTIDEAKDEGIIQNQLLSYNGSTYKTIDATTGSLKPWLGYWANTENNADGKSPSLVIPKPEECSIFPADNPWNKDISSLPVHPKSGAYMASIGLGGRLHPDFGTVWNGAPNGIPVVDVQADTPRRNVEFKYSSESDHQPYPIPDNPPIEGGPDGTGDRHIIMVDRSACKLYELFGSFPPGASENPFSDSWYAGSGAIFDLTTNNLRPDFWTSADAAGLPVYPGLVKYDEVMVQKEIRHALRFTVKKSQRAFIHPATHFASSSTDQNLPPMGLRVRLKASFDISGFPEEVQVILKALKKYGMLLADNGGNWFISGSPDPRWSVDNLSKLHNVPGSAFEAVSTGALITR